MNCFYYAYICYSNVEYQLNLLVELLDFIEKKRVLICVLRGGSIILLKISLIASVKI